MLTPSWRPHVQDPDTGMIDRSGYDCCVLDQLRTRLRRRDVYAPGSTRSGDPGAELLTLETWTEQRDTFCDELALDLEPTGASTSSPVLGHQAMFTVLLEPQSARLTKMSMRKMSTSEARTARPTATPTPAGPPVARYP